MKNRFRSKAPPGTIAEGVQRRSTRLRIAAAAVLLIHTILPASPAIAQLADPWFLPSSSATNLSATTSSDPNMIREWVDVTHFEHPGFSRWCSALGDIDGDGYDDFAMASGWDTTFIFRGGDPFDPEPAFFVLGGSTGVVAADFNGDGRRDLATSVTWKNRVDDPDGRGRIRVYFQKSEVPQFGPEPDLELRGDSAEYWGTETYIQVISAINALDFNGDGFEDLIAFRHNGKRWAQFEPLIFFGGPAFDAIPDVKLQHQEQIINDEYATGLLLGDLNGDGCDDVLIAGHYIAEDKSSVLYWDLFLGNREGGTRPATQMLRSDYGWIPDNDWSAIFDVNGDGFDDIVDPTWTREYCDALVFRGSADLPEIFVPNDSIPNPRPVDQGVLGPAIICPVGDMNGDGTHDLIIIWNTYWVPNGQLHYLFPMKANGLVRTPTGIIGIIPDNEYVMHQALDVGDVNGDGYDDFVVRGGGRAEPPTIGYYRTRRFKIFLGASNLRTAVHQFPPAFACSIDIYPNPNNAAGSGIIVRYQGFTPGPAHIELRDVLGRLLLEMPADLNAAQGEYHLSPPALPSGMYFITLCQGNTQARKPLSIL
ncbi:MAG: T9SS type A sorting domain-containing protein [Bacteroidota bacterium]